LYTKIDERLWSDEKYRKLSDDGKLLFVYVLACSHRNMIGLYLLPVQYGSYDLNWKEERFNKGLVELSDNSFIKYNFNTNIVYIKNFLKYNPLENPNQVKGAIKALDSIPANAIDAELIKELERANKPFNKPLIELLYKGLGKQEEEEEEEDVDEEVAVEKAKEKDTNTAPVYKKCLKTLQSIKDYPFNTEVDLDYIQKLENKYPTLNIPEVIDDWAIYKLDKPLQNNSNPRSQIDTSCKRSITYGLCKKKIEIKEIKDDNYFSNRGEVDG